jgi:hypothetical protein
MASAKRINDIWNHGWGAGVTFLQAWCDTESTHLDHKKMPQAQRTETPQQNGTFCPEAELRGEVCNLNFACTNIGICY